MQKYLYSEIHPKIIRFLFESLRVLLNSKHPKLIINTFAVERLKERKCMTTIITLVIYILGVICSYKLLLEWNKACVKTPDEFQTLHMISLLSWLAFVLYGITKLLNDSEES